VFPLAPYLPVVEHALLPAEVVAERESVLWLAVWATPQAVAWQRMGWTHEVALYVRLLVRAEWGDPRSMTEVRQWSDRLGLNPAAMARNRWRIVADQTAERRASRATPAPAGESVRDRLRALDGGGA
jgi:hypothetical protein